MTYRSRGEDCSQALVSIVLPTHNGSRYIRQSIESCLNLTHRNIELIVVNDASTDNTEGVVLSIDSERIRYLKSDTPLRLPAALNHGFSVARGDFLTWTSDDNYYAPSSIGRLLRVFQANPRLDVVYSDEIRVDAEGAPLGICRYRRPEYLVHFSCIGGCFLYRRRVHDEIGMYDPDTFLVEDYDFWLRAMTRGLRMCHVSEPLYYYREHGDSLTSTYQVAEVNRLVQTVRSRHVRARHLIAAAGRRYMSWLLSPSRMLRDREPRFIPWNAVPATSELIPS